MAKISSGEYIALLERETRQLQRLQRDFETAPNNIVREDIAISISIHIRNLLAKKSGKDGFIKRFTQHFGFRLMVHRSPHIQWIAELVEASEGICVEGSPLLWFSKDKGDEMIEISDAFCNPTELLLYENGKPIAYTLSKTICLISDKQGAHIDDVISDMDAAVLNVSELCNGHMSPSLFLILITSEQCITAIDKCLSYILDWRKDPFILAP